MLGIITFASACALACILDDRYNRGCNIERDPSVKRTGAESDYSMRLAPIFTKEQ